VHFHKKCFNNQGYKPQENILSTKVPPLAIVFQ
jgi:hypothetical protein